MSAVTARGYVERTGRCAADVVELAQRLDVAETTIHRLAKHLCVDLRWLEVLASPEVVHELPASWDAMCALGRDPRDGAPLSEAA